LQDSSPPLARRCRRCPLRHKGKSRWRRAATALPYQPVKDRRVVSNGKGGYRQVRSGSIQFGGPRGAGNLVHRVPGRAGAGFSVSSRRRGLRAVSLSLLVSVLIRTVEHHGKQACSRRVWLFGSRAGGTRQSSSPGRGRLRGYGLLPASRCRSFPASRRVSTPVQ
jgi:hypothetical protein